MAENVTISRDLARKINAAGRAATLATDDLLLVQRLTDQGQPDLRLVPQSAIAGGGDVSAALALKANLASPTLTGVPVAPTAAAATSTTQIATTAFVTTADNLKADLASPTFTGTPAAPTAAAATSTTQLATTAFATTADNLKASITGLAAGTVPVGFAAAAFGTGSIARTLLSKVSAGGMRVDIRDFDVDPTGVNDSTAGIQAALNQTPQYGALYFPPPVANNLVSWPKYYYSLASVDADGNCLVIPRADITLIGDQGFRLPQLRCVVPGATMIFSEYKNVSMWGLQLYGDGDIFHAGEFATVTGFRLRRTGDNADYDGFISRCAFFGLFRAVDIRGRNWEYSFNIHAGCIQGVYVEPNDPAANVGNDDTSRGDRIYTNRFHSSGPGLHVTAVTGTAQAGGTKQITLASGDAAAANAYKGSVITITGGTGSGQTNLIYANNATTKVALVKDAWTVTPNATSAYSIKSADSVSSCIWIDPGAYSGSYEYGHVISQNQADQVMRFYVGPTRRSRISENVIYNCEGGTLPDPYLGVINLLAAASNEESGGSCQNNTISGFDSDGNGKGILVDALNCHISGNHIVGMNREGIELSASSLRCHVVNNYIAQGSGNDVGTYDGIRNVGTENSFGANVISSIEGSTRRFRHGLNDGGIRTRITARQIVENNAVEFKKINLAGTNGPGIRAVLSPTTTGVSFEIGDWIELNEPVAGAPWRTVCTTAGTSGTLSITATAAASVTLTSASSTSALRRGQHILIAGDATPRKILAISGTTLTLDSATTASGAGLAVSWQAPVFVHQAAKKSSIPLTEWRKSTARNTALATTASGGDVCLANTAGSGIQDLATNNTSLTTGMRIERALPYNYATAGTLTLKMRAKVTVARQVGATITISAKLVGDSAVGSELYAGSAVTMTTSYAEISFAIPGATLAAGDVLAIVVTIDNDDTGGSTSGVVAITKTWFEYAGT